MANKKQCSTAGGAGGGAPGLSGREDVLEPERYFMGVALLTAKRSPDPHTQVGACIVNQEKKVVGAGYNKMPNRRKGEPSDPDKLPWDRDVPGQLNNKYIYVCHAELNAIVNSRGADLKGCSIYTTLFPHNECAKLIIQSGITEVVYLSDTYKAEVETIASKRMLESAGVQTREFKDFPDGNVIQIDFTPMEMEPVL